MHGGKYESSLRKCGAQLSLVLNAILHEYFIRAIQNQGFEDPFNWGTLFKRDITVTAATGIF